MEENKFSLKGRVAIVTGAAQGLGKAMAEALTKVGASVVIADINIDKAKKVAERLTSSTAKVIAIRVDVSNIKDIDKLVKC